MGSSRPKRQSGRSRTRGSVRGSDFNPIPLARGELSFSRVEEAAFNVLYVMSEREINQRPMSFRKRLMEYFVIFVDWSQMVALLTAPSFGWRPDVVSPIQSGFDIIDRIVPEDSGPFFVSAWAAVLLVVASSLSIAVYAGVSFSSQEVASLWPVRALRAVVKLFVTLLFLPLMEFLSLPLLCTTVQERYFSGYSCWHNADTVMPALSIIALCLFVPLALSMSLSYFQSNPYVADPTARPSGRFDFFVTAVRSALILIPVLLRGSRTIEAVLFSLAMLALCVYLALVLPYYLVFMNRLRCAMFAVLAWLGVGAAILSSGNIKSESGQDWFCIAWLLASSLAATAGYFAPLVRHGQLLRLAKAIDAGMVDPEALGAFQTPSGSGIRQRPRPSTYEFVGSDTDYESEMSATDGSSVTGQPLAQHEPSARISLRAPGRQSVHVTARSRAQREYTAPVDGRAMYRSAPDHVDVESESGSIAATVNGIPPPSSAAEGSIADEDVASQNSGSKGALSRRLSGPISRAGAIPGSESAPLPSLPSPTPCPNPEAGAQSFIERTNIHHLRRPPTGMLFASDVEVVCRFFILQGHVRKAQLKLCERLYRRGMDLYPLSDVLAMHFTSFLLANKTNFKLAQQTLSIAESLDPALDIRFLIFSARRYFDQKEKSSTLGTAMNTVLMLEYKKNAAEAHRNHELALKRLTKLWHHVAKRGVTKEDEGQVLQMLTRIAQARKGAQASFEALLARFPSVPDVLRSYASFRMDCMLASKDDVEPLLARADALEDAAAVERGEMDASEAKADTQSETASRVSSESRKGGPGARGTMRYQPKVSEFSVIRLTRNTLFVTLVALIMVFTMLFTVTVSTLGSFSVAVDDVAFASVRRDLTLTCVRHARDAHLAELNDLSGEVLLASSEMESDMNDFDQRNLALYTSPITLKALEDLYTIPSIDLRIYDPTSGAARAEGSGILTNETESLWSASAMYIAACREAATLRGAALNASSTAVSPRFVYDNGLTVMLPAFVRSSKLYTDQVFELASGNTELQLYLFFIGLAITEILLIVVSEMLGPILRRMSKRTNGPAAVLSAIPRSMVLELHRTAVSALRMLRDVQPLEDDAPKDTDEAQQTVTGPVVRNPRYGDGRDNHSGHSTEPRSQVQPLSQPVGAPKDRGALLKQVSARGRPNDTWGGTGSAVASDEELVALLADADGAPVGAQKPSAAVFSQESLLGSHASSSAEDVEGTSTSGSSKLPPINMAVSPSAAREKAIAQNNAMRVMPPLSSIPSPTRESQRQLVDAELQGSYMEAPSTDRSDGVDDEDEEKGRPLASSAPTALHSEDVVHRSLPVTTGEAGLDDESDDDEERQRKGQLDSMTSVEIHGLATKSKWSRHMSGTLSIALAVVSTFAIAAILMTVSSELYSSLTDENKWASNEINEAGRRVALVHKSFLLARELLVNDGEIVPSHDALLVDIEATLADLQTTHAALKQGSVSLGVQGEDGESAEQEVLMYGKPCLRANCSTVDTRPYAALVANGVDQLVFHFLRRMRMLVSRYRAGQARRTLWLGLIRSDEDFAFVKDMADNDLRNGLVQSKGLFASDARAGVDSSEGVTSWLYAMSITFLVLAFGLAYRLVAQRLQASGEQNYDLLALIPQRTVRSVKTLQHFYQKEEY